MKQSSLSISIPEPCHEKWSAMTPAEKGRHCKSCQKTVVDFTRMPKIQIAEYVSEHQGKMCGRFSSDQLNVELIPPKPTKTWLKYAAIILGLVPTIGYGQEVTRNNNPVPTHIVNDSELGEMVIEDAPKKGKINVNTISKQVNISSISGVVLDEDTREPILFGTVAVYRNGELYTGVETDLDGRFTIEIQNGDFIEASYIGYESKKSKLENIDFSKDLILYIKEGILGDVMVVGITFRGRENWLKRQWKKFKSFVEISHTEAQKNEQLSETFTDNRDIIVEDYDQDANTEESYSENKINPEQVDIKIYPNPTSGFIELNVPNHIMNYKIQISNMNNELVLSKDMTSSSNSLELSYLVTGSYVVSILLEGELIHSQMIIKI